MTYSEIYKTLRSKINYSVDKIILDAQISVFRLEFISNSNVLPGEDHYFCKQHGIAFETDDDFTNDIGESARLIDIKDSHIIENKRFEIHVFAPNDKSVHNKAIFLFHGFNEKTWVKYYPWAKRLAELTGKVVVLFPISFHMNRAPHLWSSKYEMYELSKIRKKLFPDVRYSTLSNVAISSRLHARPQRFIWSGLQTYNDVIQFIDSVREGKYPLFESSTQFDIFAYSIGALLAETLIMSNAKGYFDNTKMCLFCGGAVFNRLSPVSKFIIDSKASVALYSFLIEHFESHIRADRRLRHYIKEHSEGLNLMTMLNYGHEREHRESLFRKLSDRILAITLKNDQVIPYYEVINTLKGVERNIPIPVEVYRLPFSYTHENPFPVNSKFETDVNRYFEKIFTEASRFLK